jgi:PST family polysaccharide transporter
MSAGIVAVAGEATRDGVGGQAARGSLWALVASGLAAALQLATTAALARWLAPEAFGAVALLGVVAQLAGTLAQLGLGSALVQARRLEPGDVRAVLGLSIVQGAALSALVALLAPLCAGALRAPELARLLPVYGLTLALSAPAGVALAVLQRRLAYGRLALIQLAGLAVGTAVALGAAIGGAGVWALVSGRLATDAAVLAGALASLGALGRPSLALSRARRFASFGARVAATQLLNAAAGQLDTVLLGVSLGAAALGHYSLASSLVMLPAVRLAGVVKGVAFAALSRALRTGEDFERAALQLVLHVCALCTPPVVGLALVARDLVPLALGAGWDDTARLVVALAPAGVVFAWGSAMGAILLARGAASLELRFALLRVAVLGPLLWWSAGRAGALGAALAIASYAFLCVPLFFLVLARAGGLAPARLARALAPGVVSAAAMAPPVLGVGALLADAPALARLGAEIVMGALACAGCLRAVFPAAFASLVATAQRAWPSRRAEPLGAASAEARS